MTNIKKVCTKCKTPLTVSPYAASVPGELCRQCHSEKYLGVNCHRCGEELTPETINTIALSNINVLRHINLCNDCMNSNDINLKVLLGGGQ